MASYGAGLGVDKWMNGAGLGVDKWMSNHGRHGLDEQTSSDKNQDMDGFEPKVTWNAR